eukprot:364686-Chlamydomonas_euryale.AAC.8
MRAFLPPSFQLPFTSVPPLSTQVAGRLGRGIVASQGNPAQAAALARAIAAIGTPSQGLAGDSKAAARAARFADEVRHARACGRCGRCGLLWERAHVRCGGCGLVWVSAHVMLCDSTGVMGGAREGAAQFGTRGRERYGR